MADDKTSTAFHPNEAYSSASSSVFDPDEAYGSPDLKSESAMAKHPPVPKPMHMEPNYTALIPTQLPSGPDPHNPGNPNLNAIPPEARDKVNERLSTLQGGLLMANPFAEAATAGSWEPIVSAGKSLLKGTVGAIGGAIAGKHIGHEAGGLFDDPGKHVNADTGERIGKYVGGAAGLFGSEIPTGGVKGLILKQLPKLFAGAPEAAPVAEEALPAFTLTPPNTSTEAAIQQPINFPPRTVSDEPFALNNPSVETEAAAQTPFHFPQRTVSTDLFSLTPPHGEAPVARQTPFDFGSEPVKPMTPVNTSPEPQQTPFNLKHTVNDIANSAAGVKPLQPNVPIKDQLSGSLQTGEVPVDPITAKYPDSGVRKMVRANGEVIVDAIGDDKDLMEQVHALKNVDVREAAVKSGIDLGTKHVGQGKGLGDSQISRQELFTQMIQNGLSPKDILRLAKPPAK